MQKTVWESSLLWWTMFVLWVVMVFVYIIFFSLPNRPSITSATWLYQEAEKSGPSAAIVPLQIARWTQQSAKPVFQTQQTTGVSWTSSQRLDDQRWTKTPTYIVSTQQLFDPSYKPLAQEQKPDLAPEQILSLAWTHHRKWVMKSAKLLWFDGSIQYVLKNNDNTHFAYIGKQLPDIADALSDLSGKSIAFTSENDIHTHWLFGDTVAFLLVPQYIGKKQLFLVYFSEARDRWFIQVDADIFETTKPLLRELFTKRYSR